MPECPEGMILNHKNECVKRYLRPVNHLLEEDRQPTEGCKEDLDYFTGLLRTAFTSQFEDVSKLTGTELHNLNDIAIYIDEKKKETNMYIAASTLIVFKLGEGITYAISNKRANQKGRS